MLLKPKGALHTYRYKMAAKPESPPRTRDPERTRERILEAAQSLVLAHGYNATSVDAVVGKAGITKGAFFHHFASKPDLARALVERYAKWDREHLAEFLARSRKLASDPLEQLLVFLGLYEEELEGYEEPFLGCLFASYVYESKLFDEGTNQVLVDAALHWRREMRSMLEQVAAKHPPKAPVDLDTLADLFYTMFEGAFVMARTFDDTRMFTQQMRHLRTYLQLLFSP